MSLGSVSVRRVRWVVALGLVSVAASVMGSTSAEARKPKHRKTASASRAAPYAPPFAALVVDANSGRTMYSVSETELRHPASITKVMTLYLLFEQIERGSLSLESELKVSRHSASMAPSKLGLRPGETIDVDDAIKALVTRSANDVAATIAENIAGSEEAFAQRMTRKARQLGMKRTVYRNASGLPDREQVTTARDLAILARAIQEKFPRLYKYFQTKSFNYAGQTIGNHNRLLGRVEGVDGIKTGFTNASGFNLMTSARLDGRHVVGIVLGGRSGASRDAIMANLIRTNLAHASTSGRSSIFAEADVEDVVEPLAGTRVASAGDIETTGSTIATALRNPIEALLGRSATTPDAPRPGTIMAYASAEPDLGRAPAPATSQTGKIEARLPSLLAAPVPPEAPRRIETASVRPAPVATPAKPVVAEAPAARETSSKPSSVSPWVIQLAAESDEDKARSLLAQAKSSTGRLLSRAAPFTERVSRGGATLYRARFSGFAEADAAQDACRSLKSQGFACFATRS